MSTTISHGGVQAYVEVLELDAVQEFKVQSNFSADIGGYSGNSVINLIIRSGTNEFHGSAWEFLRNDKLAANDWFNNLYGNPLVWQPAVTSALQPVWRHRRRTYQEE